MSLSTNAMLPETSASPAYLGAYTSSLGPFPNPLNKTDLSGLGASLFDSNWEHDVRLSMPADLGQA